jgi:diguanylate cyclase (GGDEF)-like protein/PAS domain S-box-containing protein
VLFLPLLCLLCLWPAGFARCQNAPRPVLIACPTGAPPYCLRGENGEPEGLLPDYWRMVAAETDLPVQLVLTEGADALLKLEHGEVDAVAGLTLAPREAGASAQADRFAYTSPLFFQGLGIYCDRKDEARLNATSGGRGTGFTAGLLPGEEGAAAMASSYPGMLQRPFADLDALAMGLALGQARVVAGPLLPLASRLQDLGGGERFVLLREYPGTPLRAVVRKGDQPMLERLNTAIAAVDPAKAEALRDAYLLRRSDGGWSPWAAAAAICLAVCLLAVRRERSMRARAGTSAHESGLLRDSLMAEMTRHRKTQEMLLSAVEQSPSGIVIAYANRAAPPVLNSHALKILGLSAPPSSGKLPDDKSWRIYTEAGRLLKREELPLAQALHHGVRLNDALLRLALPDGSERWIRTNAAPVLGPQNEVRAGVVVFHDVTSQRQSERELARFKFFLEAGVEEVYLVRPSGQVAYVNEAVGRSLGQSREEFLDQPIALLDPSLTPEAVFHLLHSVRQGPLAFESSQRTREGRSVLKEIKAFYMRFGDEEYICGFGRDITEQSRLSRELDSTRALFSASLEQAPWGIVIGDAISRRVTIANPAAAAMLGVTPQDIVGREVNATLPIWTFLDADGKVVTPGETPLSRALDHEESTRGQEVRLIIRGGPERWLLADSAPVRGPQGEVVAAILVMADITARKRMEQQLILRAHYDSLTGLPNRDHCLELLEQTLEAQRAPGERFAVAFLDLDRFKMLNDSQGHSFGDKVLVLAARRLLEALGAQGRVCRFGGDEFVLILERTAGDEDALGRLRAAVEALGRPIVVDGQEVRVTASVGVVIGPAADSPAAENILQNADLAMHRAKDAGRDRMRLFNAGMLRRARELMALDADMRCGLERGEFVAFFQPIVTSDGGRTLGFEALARWRSPKRGLVPPHDFIAHAEDSGLIVPLGEQILKAACQTMADWRRRFPASRGMTIAVNLSARQFLQADIVETVRRTLFETGLPPALLKLELTESTLLGDPEAALSSMRRLKSLGVALSIDDFGTGYSSLSYLQRFPVDVLKIDRAFVRDLPQPESDSRSLVQAIAALAGSLRLRIVAEGVENEAQRAILAELGCQALQGFLFHPPLPPDAVEELFLALEERSETTAEAS